MSTATKLVVHRCAGCGAVVSATPKATVEHWCPERPRAQYPTVFDLVPVAVEALS